MRNKAVIYCALLIAIVLILYSRTAFFGYIYPDDIVLTIDNYNLINNPSNLPRLFTENVLYRTSGSLFYRPMLALSFILDADLGAPLPLTYHVTNILLHIIACLLLFAFFVKLKYKELHAFIFTAIFSVHPLFSQAVAWIAGRNDSLLAVFIIPSFIYLINFMEAKKPGHYILHQLFFCLALFTKETALVTVALYLLYIAVISEKKTVSPRVGALAAGWTIIVIMWYLLRSTALHAQAIGLGLPSISKSAITNLPAIIQIIGKIVFPVNLCVLPTIRDTTFIYGGITVALLAAAVIVSRGRRNNYVLFGLAWFIAFSIPTFIVPSAFATLFLEHRLYLPIIGLIIVLLETDWFKILAAHKKLGETACAIIMAGFAILAFRHCDVFRDRLAFWQNAVAFSPHSPIAHTNLANAYLAAKKRDEAITEFKKALTLAQGEDSYPYIHDGLGCALLEIGLVDEAIKEFSKAVSIDKRYANAYRNLWFAYNQRNENDKALEAIKAAIDIDPGFAKAYSNLGISYAKKGMFKNSEESFLKALSIEPRNDEYMANLATTYHNTGRFDEAIKLYEEALALNPGNPVYSRNLANTLKKKGANTQ